MPKDKEELTNPPKHRPQIDMPAPKKVTPKREQHRPEAMTPPKTKKDESVVR